MARPADLPRREYFQQLPCGTRAKYIGAGCRCMRCRAANSRYETARAAARRRGEWNGLVPAAAVRDHLRSLSQQGVGRRAVSAACGVAKSSLADIRTGRKTQLRADTARRILAVDRACIADGALVDARPTWRRIRRLQREGYPAFRLTRLLGYRGQGLQFGRRQVTARIELKVARFCRMLLAC